MNENTRFKTAHYRKWLIHSHSNGSDYDNGGRYTIYCEGYMFDKDWTFHPEFQRWDPPMKTEAEALAVCATLNRLTP